MNMNTSATTSTSTSASTSASAAQSATVRGVMGRRVYAERARKLGVKDLASERNLGVGDSGADVQQLQRFLQDEGYATASDGFFGAGTRRALESWQRDMGVATSGRFDVASKGVYLRCAEGYLVGDVVWRGGVVVGPGMGAWLGGAVLLGAMMVVRCGGFGKKGKMGEKGEKGEKLEREDGGIEEEEDVQGEVATAGKNSNNDDDGKKRGRRYFGGRAVLEEMRREYGAGVGGTSGGWGSRVGRGDRGVGGGMGGGVRVGDGEWERLLAGTELASR